MTFHIDPIVVFVSLKIYRFLVLSSSFVENQRMIRGEMQIDDNRLMMLAVLSILLLLLRTNLQCIELDLVGLSCRKAE